MRLLLVAIVTLASSFSSAQQVKVETGTGGVKVDTGAAGVQVDTGPGGTTVKTRSKTGGVTVQTGRGTTSVQTGSPAVVQPPPAPAPAADVVGDDDVELVIQDDGRTIEHTCGRDQLVIVNGDSNAITLHGPCKELHVNGASNRITTDQAQSITANGDANQIQWRSGVGGKNPKISTNGNRNTVSKLR